MEPLRPPNHELLKPPLTLTLSKQHLVTYLFFFCFFFVKRLMMALAVNTEKYILRFELYICMGEGVQRWTLTFSG